MIKFRNLPLEVIEENETYFKFRYNNKEYVISKALKVENPCNMTWDLFDEMEEDVIVKDGYAESVNGSFKCTFPTLKETFTNEENLNDALYYRKEYEDYGWFDDILDVTDLWDIFEGYYFSDKLNIIKLKKSTL